MDAIDYPPIEQFEIPELVDTAPERRQGVAFKDTYFLLRGSEAEDLHFHELVHIVQWERLGAERYLLAYGIGLVSLGYHDSPLEAVAYSLQQKFYEGFYRPKLKDYVEAQADLAWAEIERLRDSYHATET